MNASQYDFDPSDMNRPDIVDTRFGRLDDVRYEVTSSPFLDSISNMTSSMAGRSQWLQAFFSSLALILVSELGDKTFFIAAILAMKNSRLGVFFASMLALAIMTILASALGSAANVIPQVYIHWASIVLFILFGLKMLKEGYDMSEEEARGEINNVETDLVQREQAEQQNSTNGTFSVEDPEIGIIKSIPEVPFGTRVKRKFMAFVSLTFIKTFTMVFVAEWGDRSQIGTMVLAARKNPIAVTIGSLLGHCFCTGLAVLGGRFVAQKISVRTVTIVGGFTFLLFAIVAIVYGYEDTTQ